MKQATRHGLGAVLLGLLLLISIWLYFARQHPFDAAPSKPPTNAAPNQPKRPIQSSTVTVRTESKGRPIPDVGVLLQHVARSNVFYTQRTDAQGEARFAEVPLGSYQITTMHLAFGQRSRTLGVTQPSQTVTLELVPGGDTANPAPEPSTQPGTTGSVSGRVLDSDGQPIADAQVGASGIGSPHFTATDSSGYFELAGLEGTEVNLFATSVGRAAVQRHKVSVGSRNVELVMQAGAEITGRLAFAQPPDALYVRLCYPDATHEREICIKSEYYRPPRDEYLLKRVPSGKFNLVFSDSHQELKRLPLEIAPGQRVEVPLQAL